MSIVKIRLMGKLADIQRLADDIASDSDTLSISTVYPNRGTDRYGRVYIDYDLKD